FSFYPTKNLAAMGDAGLLATRDPEVAARARALRQYGWGRRYVSDEPGMNSRLDEGQAAVLRVRLETLEADNSQRGACAERYAAQLATRAELLPQTAAGVHHVYHQYVVQVPNRDAVRTALEARG